MLTRSWWSVLVRGLAAAGFGAAVLVRPHLTVGTLVLAFGAFTVADGTVGVVTAIGSGRREGWSLLVEGGEGIVAGLVALAWPGMTAPTFLVVVAAWATLRGLTQLWTAWALHRHCPREVSLAAAALAVLVAAGVLASHAGETSAATARVTGAAVAAAGLLLLVFAFRLWRWMRASRRIADMALGIPASNRRERAA